MDITENEMQVVYEVSLKGIDVFSIIASTVSIVLAILAIALSIVFYKMSKESSNKIESASKDIGSNVKRLDQVFEKMYTDTFGMVKETVSDMRKHVYKGNSHVEDKKVEKQINESIAKAVEGFKKDEINKDDVKDLVLHFIDEYKGLEQEVRTKSIKNQIIQFLRDKGSATYPELVKLIYGGVKKDTSDLFITLQRLRDEEIIYNPFKIIDEEDGESISHSTKIELKVNG
ncbi:hypothetical protein [Alkalihalobacillus pseudalcaliphilus]|uniref:hypothetical protein n=1 Tax=Alkalihalobacillus pseudalcaliphilus TaxID=79884 RepID=UPI00064DC0C2|nr:hypothetical protein [Alkalihalobacillus pseudalcaliphilus]KMK77615.1 hypothetical protein AB990_03900 [Alkalihalobacillus pseudalcaliphilus]